MAGVARRKAQKKKRKQKKKREKKGERSISAMVISKNCGALLQLQHVTNMNETQNGCGHLDV
jgi:hypothetical protein